VPPVVNRHRLWQLCQAFAPGAIHAPTPQGPRRSHRHRSSRRICPIASTPSPGRIRPWRLLCAKRYAGPAGEIRRSLARKQLFINILGQCGK
jgi:hypothetical protein